MAHGAFKNVLKNGGFVAFLWTQFLGAFNDNAYRIIVSLRAVHIVAQADQSGKYLALAGAIFVLPSLLFTGYAGQLADAISKRKVLIGVKIFEIAVMALGIVVFFSHSVAWMFVVLFLMAVHYTVFSPAKYSIVPELVSDRDLSRANALLEMTTLVAIEIRRKSLALLLCDGIKNGLGGHGAKLSERRGAGRGDPFGVLHFALCQ